MRGRLVARHLAGAAQAAFHIELNMHSSANLNQIFRIVFGDACEILRLGLQHVLEPHGFDIVGEASDADTLVRVATEQRPDLVIVDADLPEARGTEFIRRLAHVNSELRILVFTSRSERVQILRILKAGAHGYLLKSAPPAELLHAVRSLMQRHTYLSPAAATVISSLVTSPDWSREPDRLDDLLSERETQVLQCIVEGQTSKEIATNLQITVRTIESHRAQLMRKLNLRSVAALTKYAIREGLTSPHP